MFSANNIDFLTLRDRKHHFDVKIILETCSGTSNYPWDTISWHLDMFWDTYGRRMQKRCEKRPKCRFSATFWRVFIEDSLQLRLSQSLNLERETALQPELSI